MDESLCGVEGVARLLPVIVLANIDTGFRTHVAGGTMNNGWPNTCRKFRILGVDEWTPLSFSAVHTELRRAGMPTPSNDVRIAALPLLSRNRQFDALGDAEGSSGNFRGFLNPKQRALRLSDLTPDM